MTTVVRRAASKTKGVTVVKRLIKPIDVDALVAERDALRDRLARIKKVVTLVDNGAYVVGWDTCGHCLYHISQCNCPNGPTPPKYIERWMGPDPASPPSVEVTP